MEEGKRATKGRSSSKTETAFRVKSETKGMRTKRLSKKGLHESDHPYDVQPKVKRGDLPATGVLAPINHQKAQKKLEKFSVQQEKNPMDVLKDPKKQKSNRLPRIAKFGRTSRGPDFKPPLDKKRGSFNRSFKSTDRPDTMSTMGDSNQSLDQ